MSPIRYHATATLRRLAPLVLILGFAWVLLPSPANAIFGVDCKDAPALEAPGGGIGGWFENQPAKGADQGPAFIDGAPNVAQYGLAGQTFNTYDLGCGPDATRDPGAVIGTTIANWGFEASKFGVALSSGALNAAYNPTYLSAFNPLVENVVGTLRNAIFGPWAPVTIAVIGALLLWSSRKGNWSKTVTITGWALLVLVIATAIFRWPVQAGQIADDSVSSTLATVNTSINGGATGDDPLTAAQQSMVSAVLWEQWKMGTFGRSNSETAEKYAERVYKDTTLTWAEAQAVRDGDDSIVERKQDDFKDVASQIEKEDPDAYQYLTGKKATGRIGAAMISMFALLCALPFVLGAALLMIGAYLIIRMAVMFFPAIATVGIAYQARGAVTGLGSVVVAAVANTIMFGIGLAVDLLALRTLLDPRSGLPTWLALTLMGVVTFILWVATKPMRRLTTMASPNNLFGDAAGAFGRVNDQIRSATGTALKAAIGGAVAGAAGAKVATELGEHDDSHQRGPRTEGYTAPASTPRTAPTVEQVGGGTGPDAGAPLVGVGAPAPVQPSGPGGTSPEVGYVGRHAALGAGASATTDSDAAQARVNDAPALGAPPASTETLTSHERDLYSPKPTPEAPSGDGIDSVGPGGITYAEGREEDGTMVYDLFSPTDDAQAGDVR